MGVKFKIDSGYVTGEINGRLKGANIDFEKISVGATENILMAATVAEGRTIINNAAREPEITDLSKMLIKMGANIRGYGTKKITIVGKKSLTGCDYKIMPDRIESGTFALCVFGCSGKIQLDMSSDITKDIEPGRYYYDILLSNTNTGMKTRVIEGMAMVSGGIS